MKKIEKRTLKMKGQKLQFQLIPPECEREIAKTLTLGATRHAPHGYKYISPDKLRDAYHGALRRHENERRCGWIKDKDGMYHWASVAANAIILLWRDLKDNKLAI